MSEQKDRQECPCEDGKPDPCPKCGASAAMGVCGRADIDTELLEAVKALIRAYEIVVSNGGGSFNRHFPDAAGKGYAVIRKAEGR